MKKENQKATEEIKNLQDRNQSSTPDDIPLSIEEVLEELYQSTVRAEENLLKELKMHEGMLNVFNRAKSDEVEIVQEGKDKLLDSITKLNAALPRAREHQKSWKEAIEFINKSAENKEMIHKIILAILRR